MITMLKDAVSIIADPHLRVGHNSDLPYVVSQMLMQVGVLIQLVNDFRESLSATTQQDLTYVQYTTFVCMT